MGDTRPKIQYLQLPLAFMAESRGEPQDADREGTESPAAKRGPQSPTVDVSLMEEVCERENLEVAWQQVRSNQGSPGVDGRTIDETRDYLREHWPTIRDQLLNGTYEPLPVRRVEIAKPDGGVRKLGIPAVLDRLIQQAILQVLQGRWDPTFSEHSFGFRPGRSAHQAVAQAQSYVAEGHEWVVDIDLEKFFDRVNHDILMDRVARRISDKRLLRLIRAYLNAGVMENGLVGPTDEGVPQGGIITPPTMLQTTLLGAPFKRGRTDPIHDADLLLVDLDLLHQGPDDLPSRVPVGLLQLLGNAPGELLQLADHQPQFRFLGGLAHLLPTLGLQLGQALARRQEPRLEFGFVEQPIAISIDQSRNHPLEIMDQLVGPLHLAARAGLRPSPPLVLRPDPLGLGQELTHVFPDGGVQDIGTDLLVPA